MNRRQQILAFAAIGLVAFFVLDKLLLTPLANRWKEKTEAIAQLHKSIDKGRSTLEREKITRDRWNQMRKSTLPLNASAAEQELLKAFEQWSSDSKISVTSIKPQWKRGMSEDYSTLECRVDASGSMPTLTRFLYEVEHSPMALKIESVEITTRDSNGQQLALGLLVSGLRLAPVEGK